MQNIIERLEKFGKLAVMADVARRRNKKRRKTGTDTEEGCEDFYDLDDEFIDDGDEPSEDGSETDFSRAEKEGFFMLPAAKY